MIGIVEKRMTADDLLSGRQLAGRRAVVTGGATGIGLSAVTALANAGAEVIIASRNVENAAQAMDVIGSPGNSKVSHVALDLSDLDMVRDFARSLGDTPIDYLINNAGLMGGPLRRTAQGFEMLFAVNFLSHFLLSVLLADNIANSTGKRMVILTSGSHRYTPFDLDDPNFETTAYDADLAYRRSKVACALMAVGFQRRFGRFGIDAFAVSPGVVRTGLLLDGVGEEAIDDMMTRVASLVRTPSEAAATIIYAATAEELSGRGGLYLEDCAPAHPADPYIPGGVMPHVTDPDNADRLWRAAEAMVGLTADAAPSPVAASD